MFDDPIHSPVPLIRRVESALRTNKILRGRFTDFKLGDGASLTLPTFSWAKGLRTKTFMRVNGSKQSELVSGYRTNEDGQEKGIFQELAQCGIRAHKNCVTTVYNSHCGTNPRIMIMDFDNKIEAANAHDGMAYGYA